MFRTQAFATAVFAALALSGCAPSIPVQNTQFSPLATLPSHDRVRVARKVSIRLSTGFSRQVSAGSTWRPVGQVPQGTVLQPVGTVFTIEGRQVHEAYLVVPDDALVGLFLPGESHFSPLDPVQPVTIERIQ